MSRSTPRKSRLSVSLSRLKPYWNTLRAMNATPAGIPPLNNTGDVNFRNIGMDTVETGERYGYRAFKVIATTSRGEAVKFGGVDHKRPLRLVDHPMNGKLASIYREYLYGPGLNTAACQPYHGKPHVCAPHLLEDGTPHGCGFYAYGSTGHPDAQVPENSYDGNLSVYARAIVAGSGTRVVGTKGFLSEHLRVVAIAFPLSCSLGVYQTDGRHAYDLFGPKLERLVQKNYPGAAIFNSVARMVQEFPLTDLPELPQKPKFPGTN